MLIKQAHDKITSMLLPCCEPVPCDLHHIERVGGDTFPTRQGFWYPGTRPRSARANVTTPRAGTSCAVANPSNAPDPNLWTPLPDRTALTSKHQRNWRLLYARGLSILTVARACFVISFPNPSKSQVTSFQSFVST